MTKYINYRPYKRPGIFKRCASFCRRVYWDRVAYLVVIFVWAAFMLYLIAGLFTGRYAPGEVEPTEPETTHGVEMELPTADTEMPHVFETADGTPINMQAMTAAWAVEAGLSKRYDLTDFERYLVAQVVTAEAGGEPYAGMLAVAQCILQACEDDDIRPTEAVVRYKYTPARPEPSEKALEAVGDVFDLGRFASTEPIKYFYAPGRTQSRWHEAQIYVMTINGHRFFRENTENTK